MIHVSDRELKRAYEGHIKTVKTAVDPLERSILLLLFYAVECGLKYCYCRNNSLKTTEENRFIDMKFGHDLSKILEELKAPRELYSNLKSIDLIRDRVSIPKDYHEMWRYGAQPRDKKDTHLLYSKLLNISQWIERQVRIPGL